MLRKARLKKARKRGARWKPPPPDGLSITELAAQVGTSPRAIRHYLACGALPPPEFRSSRTRYGRDHLARLFAIRTLLGDGFDLDAIRRRLRALTPAELEAYLPPPAPAAPPEPAISATESPLSANAPWHRIELLPGVELHVRAGVSSAIQRLVNDVVEQFVGTAKPSMGA